jgi:hypothetical protein
MTFYRRHFGLINRSERFVSHRYDRRVRNGTTVTKQVSNTFQYVSVQQTSGQLFSIKELRDVYLSDRAVSQ